MSFDMGRYLWIAPKARICLIRLVHFLQVLLRHHIVHLAYDLIVTHEHCKYFADGHGLIVEAVIEQDFDALRP